MCSILNKIKKNEMIQCPNSNCDTWWKNQHELNKHQNFHCRLKNDEKLYFNSLNSSINKLDRRNNNDYGLPNKTIILNKNKVTYDIITKEWKCNICGFTRNKYNRHQVMNHAKTKHRLNIHNKQVIKNRGMHIEKQNDTILQMERDYGRITTFNKLDESNNVTESTHLCQSMGCTFNRKTK